jgi:class 3 adenylate cyclase/esterase/lipase
VILTASTAPTRAGGVSQGANEPAFSGGLSRPTQAWKADFRAVLTPSGKTGLVDRPQTQFVAVGDADVAYQVLGDGPPDLLLFNGFASHVELNWQMADYDAIFRRLASFTRLIMFDRRGAGASDEGPRNATWEEATEDARAVLDAVGSKSAAVLGVADTGPMAMLFAAMYPDRVTALVLVSSAGWFMLADDSPIEDVPRYLSAVEETTVAIWGTPDLVRMANPSRANDQEFLTRGAAINRASATPRKFADYLKQVAVLDARPAMPLIQVPTLVLHSKDNYLVPIAIGRHIADHIDGAKFIELPGGDFGLLGDSPASVPDEIAEFLTGQRPIEVERILATVLFTDIVGSTAKAASLGDKRWRSLLDTHDQIVREQLKRFRGREINTTGDGFVASFDGPARAIRCAEAVIEATNSLGIDLRAGIHTGECEVRGDDLGGLAVHIAARVGALGSSGEVLVSSTVKDLVVGSGIEFDDRGEHELKGVPGTWKLFAVEG